MTIQLLLFYCDLQYLVPGCGKLGVRWGGGGGGMLSALAAFLPGF